jgi:predicted transcriptional regulator
MNSSLRRFRPHKHEQWLADHRADIAAKIEHGFAQAERGELVDGEEAFRHLCQRHDQHPKQS